MQSLKLLTIADSADNDEVSLEASLSSNARQAVSLNEALVALEFLLNSEIQ